MSNSIEIMNRKMATLQPPPGWKRKADSSTKTDKTNKDKEIQRLREALKFYAELDGNGIQLYGEMDSKALEFIDGASFPFGQTARDALKGGKE